MSSMFRTLLASTGLAAVAAAPAAAAGAEDAPVVGPNALTEAQMETMLTAAKAEGVTAGATAERERTATVFASDAGKANMTMAAWMLSSSPSASAESIVTQLGSMPKGAAPAAAVEPPAGGAAPDAPKPPLTADLSGTPAVDLGAEHQDGDRAGEAATKAETTKYIDSAIEAAAITAGGRAVAKPNAN
jgi:hypothetical protein